MVLNDPRSARSLFGLFDRSQSNSIFTCLRMRVMSLSLLHVAIWLTSTTFALVARRSSLEARGDTIPACPNGYDARTCPLDRTSITLQASPAPFEADSLPGAVRIASTSSKTRRGLIPDDLAQICRQVAHFAFTGPDYYRPPPYTGRILTLTSSTVQPGLYVGSLKADNMIRGLEIDDAPDNAWQYGNIARVDGNHKDHIGVQFRVWTPARLKMTVRFWSANTAGEFGIFKIGPSGYNGPPLRMGYGE